MMIIKQISKTEISEGDEVKIYIDYDNKIKINVNKTTQKGTEELSVDDNNSGNNEFMMADNNPRPDGQMVGTSQQLVYWGGNLYQQQPPFTTQPLPAYTSQQQVPPAEEPTRIETEARSDYVYTPEGRNRFIKRIMTLVFIMLMMTAAFIAVVLAVPDVKEVFDHNRFIILLPSIFIIMVVNYAMTFLSPCTRVPPCNIFFLFLSVVGMSLLCGVVTSYFETQIVLYAFVATTAVVLMCILLACTSFDFTSYMLYVIVIVTAFSVLALVILAAMLMAQVELRPTFLAVLVIATLLQVIIFTIHLQTVIGGKRVELREQDYALGAYMLYMSIIDIFVKMVFMFGISSEM